MDGGPGRKGEPKQEAAQEREKKSSGEPVRLGTSAGGVHDLQSVTGRKTGREMVSLNTEKEFAGKHSEDRRKPGRDIFYFTY
jgi:hypothetical protein